jgi:hypothetical protein
MLRLVPFRSRLAFCVQAPEPRAREDYQDLARPHNTTLTHPLGKEEGWGTPYYPRWASSDGLW